MLFPPLRGGLSLVVEEFSHKWIHGLLSGHLLCPLLYYQVGYWRSRVNLPLFWIYQCHGILLLFVNRNYWFLRLLLVCQKNIQCCESGLNQSLELKYYWTLRKCSCKLFTLLSIFFSCTSLYRAPLCRAILELYLGHILYFEILKSLGIIVSKYLSYCPKFQKLTCDNP